MTQVGDEPALGVQVLTAVGPVTVGAGQVVVTQLLPDVDPDATHGAGIGTFVVSFVPQVVVVKPLPAIGAIPAQPATPVGPVLLVEQIVSTKLFPATGATLLHVAIATGRVVIGGGQVSVTHEFPAVAVCPVQEATGWLL